MRQTDAFPELHRATRPREAVGAFTAHVIAIDVLAPDVRRLVLQLSKPSFRYRAGQYVSLLLPDGSLRSLSPACAPRDDGRIIFHVQRRPGGRLSGLVFGGFAPGDRIAVDGPFGDCADSNASRPPITI
jgi:NAD(P)H-flavin reductase